MSTVSYGIRMSGMIEVFPPLSEMEADYLHEFSQLRHVSRSLGPYTLEPTHRGEGRSFMLADDVHDYNTPCAGQPSLWCNWTVGDELTCIEWNGHQDFPEPEKWMEYLIDHLLGPDAQVEKLLEKGEIPSHQRGLFTGFTFDHVLNGAVIVQEADIRDRWKLVVTDNVVSRIDLE